MHVKWLLSGVSTTRTAGFVANRAETARSGTINPPFSGLIALTSRVGMVSARQWSLQSRGHS